MLIDWLIDYLKSNQFRFADTNVNENYAILAEYYGGFFIS